MGRFACLVLLSVAVIGFSYAAPAPQFGGFSQANAQAGAFGSPYQSRPGFGGGYGGGGYGGGYSRPGYGHGAFGGGFGGPGRRQGPVNISISKSVSIGGGPGGGLSSSSANSAASGK